MKAAHAPRDAGAARGTHAVRAVRAALVAVFIAGLMVGNQTVRAFPSIVNFHDTATWLCQIVMFLMLGLLVTPSNLITYAPQGLAIALFLMIIGRPAAVWICLKPFGFTPPETNFVSWVGLVDQAQRCVDDACAFLTRWNA